MNKKQMIDTNRLFLGGMRFFSKEDNGAELSDNLGYAVLYKIAEDIYINIMNPLEEYPVFLRVPYTNVSSYGEEYGTKLALVSKKVETGPCYVISSSFKELLKVDNIDLEGLEDYILNSSYYFIDRTDIAKDRLKKNPRKMNSIIKNDSKSYEEMVEFFENRKVAIKK